MEFSLMKLVGQSIRPGSIFGILDKDNPRGASPPKVRLACSLATKSYIAPCAMRFSLSRGPPCFVLGENDAALLDRPSECGLAQNDSSASNSLIRHRDASLRQQNFSVADLQRETEIEPNRLLIDLRREPIAVVEDFGHWLGDRAGQASVSPRRCDNTPIIPP